MTTETTSIAPVTLLTAAEITQQLTDILSDVQSVQATYKSQRGKAALASMIASAFVLIEKILANIDPKVQAIILDQHQVKTKAGSSVFTPWINCVFGEEKKGDKVKALDGFEYAPWEPNPSMAVYHHTMEELRAAGFSHDSEEAAIVDHILKNGGSQTMANARKKRLADARTEANAPTVEAQRELYLQDGPAIVIELPGIKVPDDADKFISVLVERKDGVFVVRGLASKNASGALTKIAADQYAGLKAARDTAEQLKVIQDEADARAYERVRAEQQSAPVPADSPGRPRLTAEMMARAAATVAASAQRADDAAA